MGVFPETLLLVQLNMKEATQETIIKEKNNSQNESIGKQTSMDQEEEEDQEAINKAKPKPKSFNRIRRRGGGSNSLMKKRRSVSTRIEQRVSTLRNLVPNINNDEGSVGSLEQLFAQTADYILSLQTRVRLMKTLVDVLSGSSSNDHE